MGMPVCTQLGAAGFEVTCTDIEPGRRRSAEAAGARWYPDAAAVAAGVEVAVTVLPGAAEVGAVIDTVIGSLAPGAV